MESKEVKYNLDPGFKSKSDWVKPVLQILSTSLTQDTGEQCAPTKFAGTGDSLGPTGPDCGLPIS